MINKVNQGLCFYPHISVVIPVVQAALRIITFCSCTRNINVGQIHLSADVVSDTLRNALFRGRAVFEALVEQSEIVL